MKTPMELPPVAQTNSGRMNRHLNKIRDCLRTIHSYEPPPVKRSRGGSAPCALARMKPDPDAADDVYLNAGQIIAGGVSADVGGEDTTFSPAIGHHVWAEVTLEGGLDDDGFLDGSFTASAAALATGAAVPDAHAWTEADASGKSYRSLGSWVDDGSGEGGAAGQPKWEAEGCGHVTFLFCAATGKVGTSNSYRG